MNYDIPLKRIHLHYTGKYISFNPLFWLEYSQKTILRFRIGIFIPIILSILSCTLHFPQIDNSDITSLLVILRLRFLIPLLLIAFSLSFLPRFRKIMLQSQIISGIILSAYLIAVDFLLVNSQPYLYFTLFLLYIICFMLVSKIRFIGALIFGAAIPLIYTAGVIFLNFQMSQSSIVMHYCLLFTTLLCSLWLSHNQEVTARKLFIIDHLLENEIQKSRISQIELERMTMRHTSEMIATNKQLYSKYSELLHSEQQLQEAIVHDTLTTLPHRFLFMDRLNHAADISKLNKTSFTVMVINIDHFRSVNDAYGTIFGDRVLQEIAKRLKSSIHEGNTISRLGGDEFGVIIEDMRSDDDAHNAAEKLRADIKQAIVLDNQTLYVTGCIGYAIYPFDGENSNLLFKNASTALEKAKSMQINTIQRFEQCMDNHTYERMTLGNQLRTALTNNEYLLEYQPQYHALSKQIIGLEALIRWNHPNLGMIPPSHFIPLAEEIGVISSIGEWVMRTACQQMKKWQEEGNAPVPVSVNVSGVQLKQKSFVDEVKAILQETEIDPGLLELELTENIVFQNIENNMQLLKQLRGLGVKLAIDDFGAGYSTLSHLARLPITTIKIDQLFASNIMQNPQDAAVVSGIIAIAEKLNLNLIAEGIETYEQLNFYINQGCFHIQGWYFNPSLPPNQIMKMLSPSVKTKSESN
ncbi:MAG: EAL domain-containing protein [Anaerolineaceae bacterium]|nr:EAL domain-containing protein [Anaerolineaceae bacterium]